MEFTPGIELSRRFHAEAVRPILRRELPRLRYTAALIGYGSEVLGFDTPRSTDHNWGPRLLLFADGDGARIPGLLADHLPRTFLGYPTHFVTDEEGTRHLASTTGRPDHGVIVAGLDDWVRGTLGFDPRRPVRADWLATPTQIFAEFTGGAVFHDDLGLEALRRQVAWYPDDVWRYVLACQWQRIGQEEAFVGRCGEAGDELGSAVVAARLVRDLMRLCLLMARRYPPYSKWLGSAFARLPVAARLSPHLTAALAATAWRERERHLVAAYECVAGLHNDLGLTAPVEPRTSGYYDRPFRVIHAGRFVTPLLAGARPPALTGAIDQFVDNTDALGDRTFTRGVVDCRMAEPKPRDLAALLLTLTVVTGVVDAVSFLGLGRVFVANMTGNVVFFGFAAAGETTLSVLASLTAVLAFLAGALAGGRLARREDDYDALRQATAVQAGLIAVAVVLSATVGGGSRLGSELLIVVLGLAMGLQNAAVRRIGAPDLTTTVLTMTLTGFAADSKAAGGAGAHPLRKIAAVGAMLAGAFAGGLLQLHVAMWVALTLALVLVLGVVAALGLRRGGLPSPAR